MLSRLPACHIAEGSCFNAKDVTEVDAGVPNSIQPVIAGLADGSQHAIVLTGGGSVGHTITIANTKIIAIVSDSTAVRRVQGIAGGSPTITVNGGGSVAYLHRLEIAANTDSWGITAISGAALYADSVQIGGNDGGVRLDSNASGFLRNTMVGANSNNDAVSSTNSTLEILYSTLGTSTFGTQAGLRCTAGNVVVRNSIVMLQGGTDGAEVVCPAGTFTFSAFEGDIAGNGNASTGTLDTGWFEDFDNGLFGLTPSGDTTFVDIAEWQTDDPPFDFDGTTRPAENGSPDYPGADVP